jgi:ABC-type uncharacterized transport system substrate-binding protein
MLANRKRIADFAFQRRLPSVYELREAIEDGGLISYGPSRADLSRRAATYADKILKGARPADLPVEQPIKFELVLNLKTAKALGIMFPPDPSDPGRRGDPIGGRRGTRVGQAGGTPLVAYGGPTAEPL